MSVFVPYRNARGAIHDLEHAGGLSVERTIPLLLSPRVLYVLQNLANLDTSLECRYATSLETQGYQRLTSDDTEYPAFLELVSDIRLQLRERQAGMGTLLNYREVLAVQASNTNAQAGTNLLEIQGPGTDEVWIIDHIAYQNHSNALTGTFLTISSGGVSFLLDQQGSLGADVWRHYVGPVHLSNSVVLKVGLSGCVAGDDIYLQITGRIMDLV